MKKCEYIYADGFRFESGTLIVDIPGVGRLAVVRDGDGTSRLDRFKDNPRGDGAVGEITLKDLQSELQRMFADELTSNERLLTGRNRRGDILDCTADTIHATVMTTAGRVTVNLAPGKAIGREGREWRKLSLHETLMALPEDKRIALAEIQINTMPYGTKDSYSAMHRLDTVLEVLPDGALRAAIAAKSTNFLKHYTYKMAEHLKQNRPLDYATIDRYAQSTEAMLDGSGKDIRNAHLAAEILGPVTSTDIVDGTAGTRIKSQVDMVKELTDQGMLQNIFANTRSELLRQTALFNITDQTVLRGIALGAGDPELREIATGNLTERTALHKIALNDTDGRVRQAAVSHITDKDMLLLVACQDTDPDVSMLALGLLGDMTLLQEVVERPDTNPLVGTQAKAMLHRLNSGSPKRQEAALTAMRDDVLALMARNAIQSPDDFVARAGIRRRHGETVDDMVRNTMELHGYAFGESGETGSEQSDVPRKDGTDALIADQKKLIKMARNADAGWKYRVVAIQSITDQKVLVEIALDTITVNDTSTFVKLAAIAGIHSEKALKRIALSSEDAIVREAALERIEGTDALTKIARDSEDAVLRGAALQRLQDREISSADHQKTLIEIARNDPDEEMRESATVDITDPEILAVIARDDKSRWVQVAADRAIDGLKFDKMWRGLNLVSTVSLNATLGSDGIVRTETGEHITDPTILLEVARRNLGLPSRATKEPADNPATNANVPPKRQQVWIGMEGYLCDETDTKITDQKKLIEIARREGAAWKVRSMAIRDITDQEVLTELALGDLDDGVRGAATRSSTDQKTLEKVALHDKNRLNREQAVVLITDPAVLVRVAGGDEDNYVREKAVERIDNQLILATIGRGATERDAGVRNIAIRRLHDQAALFDIACDDPYGRMRLAAISNLHDETSLQHLVLHGGDGLICRAALENITDMSSVLELAQQSDSHRVRTKATEMMRDAAEVRRDNLAPNPRRGDWDIISVGDDETVRAANGTVIVDQTLLANIACTSRTDRLAKAAMRQVTDQTALKHIALDGTNPAACMLAARRIVDAGVEEKGAYYVDQWNAVDINAVTYDSAGVLRNSDTGEPLPVNRTVLAEMATVLAKDRDTNRRQGAVKRLNDPAALVHIVTFSDDPDVVKMALDRLRDAPNKTAWQALTTATKGDQEVLIDWARSRMEENEKISKLGRGWQDVGGLDIISPGPDPKPVTSDVARQMFATLLDREPKDDRETLTDSARVQNDDPSGATDDPNREFRDWAMAVHLGSKKSKPNLSSDEQKQLTKVALGGGGVTTRVTAARSITDQKQLIKIARTSKNTRVQEAAVEGITDQKALAKIVQNNDNIAVWYTAIQHITDSKILTKIALKNPNKETRAVVVRSLTNETVLKKIAWSDKDISVQVAAIGRITNLEVLDGLAGHIEVALREAASKRLHDIRSGK